MNLKVRLKIISVLLNVFIINFILGEGDGWIKPRDHPYEKVQTDE